MNRNELGEDLEQQFGKPRNIALATCNTSSLATRTCTLPRQSKPHYTRSLYERNCCWLLQTEE